MINCTNCGNQIADNAMNCPFCGAPVAKQPIQQPYGQQPYGQPMQQPYGMPMQQPYGMQKTNGAAVAGFVLSIVGLFLTLWGIIPIIGIVLSAIALKTIGQTGEKGKGLAIAGLVIGIIDLVWVLFAFIMCASYTSYFL